MAKATVAVCAFLTLCARGAWSQRVDVAVMDPEVYCKGRSDIELFRMKRDLVEEEARSFCATYYRCVPSGGGRKRISKMRCPFGLYFDVESQTCDQRLKVDNCATWQKHQKAQPKWPLDVDDKSNCEPGMIECGSGECIARALFCDHTEDCADGSDENICNNPETDPNAAAKCNPRECIWEEGCFCSVDGTRIPGNLLTHQVPQMITITFSGSVAEDSFNVYREIFGPGAKNKGNDCSAKGTFFVSHAFTNYSAVQELHRLGHEIAVGSITSNPDKKYWSSLSAAEYEAEFDEGRLIAEEFANITEGDIMGMRLPVGRIGGNEQFRMMEERGFLYDSSIAAHRGPLPLWPYILEHRMPHKCIGTDQNCPTRKFPVWEMVMNELDRRDDHMFSESLTGCYSVDQCSNIIEPKQLRSFLDYNLQHHYATNRAPLGLHFSSSYFLTRKPLLREFAKWVADVGTRGDFYFVTMMQAIHWMQTPTEVASLNTFEEWKNKCDPKGLPFCSLPNPCENKAPRHPMLRSEATMYLYTCKECPRAYPWLYDPYGHGLDDLAVLKK